MEPFQLHVRESPRHCDRQLLFVAPERAIEVFHTAYRMGSSYSSQLLMSIPNCRSASRMTNKLTSKF